MAQNIDLSNLDEILNNTTPEDLQELRHYLLGEEKNSYHCDKTPTGPLDMDGLRRYMEETAKTEEDWPELVPHISPKKRPEKTESQASNFVSPTDSAFDATIQQALDECDPDDFAELAAILGAPGLITQDQHHKATKSDRFVAPIEKFFPEDSLNDIDVSASIEKLYQNSPDLTELNLNNVKDIPLNQFSDLCESLRHNTHLKNLSLSSTGLTDGFLRLLSSAVKDNHSLSRFELSSNFLSGSALVEFVGSLNRSATEVRMSNQRPFNLGSKAENDLLALLMDNDNLRVLSADFTFPNVRYAIQKKLQDNSFNARRRK